MSSASPCTSSGKCSQSSGMSWCVTATLQWPWSSHERKGKASKRDSEWGLEDPSDKQGRILAAAF